MFDMKLMIHGIHVLFHRQYFVNVDDDVAQKVKSCSFFPLIMLPNMGIDLLIQ